MNHISKILIANRGEIASRIIKSAHDLNVSCVAIFNEADSNSPYVYQADESVRITGSYLDGKEIVQLALKTNAQAIHPGYGFLSENAKFAKLVEKSGLIWIGPSPRAIKIMGDKIESKKYAIKANVPVLENSEKESDANKIGYPLLVKAAAGGGGKGMRLVRDPKELKDSIKMAKQESLNSFNDDRVFFERYVDKSRHIEIQILADNHGNIIHLGERECSIQRRHQKIIEESPSIRIDDATREKLTSAAVSIAEKIKYSSAGTVEFLFDDNTGEFWFLEMNTRLQVEHPVTEMVTGVDLVKEQLKIADDQSIEFNQEHIVAEGHAIEVRVYAEDPSNNFLPSTGQVIANDIRMCDHIRWDTGIEKNMIIGTDFDPMLAKVIAHGKDRKDAAEKLVKELETIHFGGFINNIEFLRNILVSHQFLNGETTTDFIELHEPATEITLTDHELNSLAITAALWLQGSNRNDANTLKNIPSGWHNARLPYQSVNFLLKDQEISVEYKRQRNGSYKISNGSIASIHHWSENSLDIELDGIRNQWKLTRQDDLLLVQYSKGSKLLTIIPRFISPEIEAVEGSMTSPMPGKVIEIMVKEGDKVKIGEKLVVIEAMKMNHTITAHQDGLVEQLFISEGEQLELGASLMIISNNKGII